MNKKQQQRKKLKFKVNEFNDLENFVFKEVAVAVALAIIMVLCRTVRLAYAKQQQIVCT